MGKDAKELIAESKAQQRCIPIAQAWRELQENNGYMIDVREASEVQEQLVETATSIPRGVLEMKLPQVVADTQAPIYIHCASGGRASLAAEQIQRMGYANVSVIDCDVQQIIEQEQGER
jgi:rhodanese-related sulfurtransferase